MANTATSASAFNWTRRTTTTIQKFNKKLIDNISQQTPVLAAFKAAGAIETIAPGEKSSNGQFGLPLMYGLNSDLKWHGSDFDTIEATVQDGITTAWYDFGFFTVPVLISERQKERNQSENGIISLVETVMKQAKLTASETIEKTICGYGTASGGTFFTRSTNQPQGIIHCIYPYDSAGALALDGGSSSNQTWNTFGGITATGTGSSPNWTTSTNGWWLNNSIDHGAYYGGTSGSTYYANIEDILNEGTMQVSQNNGRVRLWLTDRMAYKLLGTRGVAKININSTGSIASKFLADLGHPHTTFDGATVVWSQYLINPNEADGSATYLYGVAFGIDTEFTKLYVNPDNNMRFTGLEPVKGDSEQLVERGFFRHECALATSNRRANVVVHEIGKTS